MPHDQRPCTAHDGGGSGCCGCCGGRLRSPRVCGALGMADALPPALGAGPHDGGGDGHVLADPDDAGGFPVADADGAGATVV
jgi:hypothetical protein